MFSSWYGFILVIEGFRTSFICFLRPPLVKCVWNPSMEFLNLLFGTFCPMRQTIRKLASNKLPECNNSVTPLAFTTRKFLYRSCIYMKSCLHVHLRWLCQPLINFRSHIPATNDTSFQVLRFSLSPVITDDDRHSIDLFDDSFYSSFEIFHCFSARHIWKSFVVAIATKNSFGSVYNDNLWIVSNKRQRVDAWHRHVKSSGQIIPSNFDRRVLL